MKILIIDIETTGFSSTKNSIVEIGIVSLDLTNGKIEIVFDRVFREKKTTTEEITESWIVQSGFINPIEIINAAFLEDYKEEIQEILNKYPLGATAFNSSFDFRFLDSREFIFPKKLDCPMKVARNVVEALNKNGAIKNPNVEEAYEYFFGRKQLHRYEEIHRGADDAVHEAKIVYELYKLGEFTI